jgi:hypothetical protein
LLCRIGLPMPEGLQVAGYQPKARMFVPFIGMCKVIGLT